MEVMSGRLIGDLTPESLVKKAGNWGLLYTTTGTPVKGKCTYKSESYTDVTKYTVSISAVYRKDAVYLASQAPQESWECLK